MIFLLVSFCSTKTRVIPDTKASIITHCCSKTYKNIQLKSYTFQNLNAIDLTKIYDKAVCDTLWDDTHTSYAPLFQCNKVLRLTYRSPVEFDVSQVGADAGFFGTDSVTVKVTGQDDERVAVGIWRSGAMMSGYFRQQRMPWLNRPLHPQSPSTAHCNASAPPMPQRILIMCYRPTTNGNWCREALP